MNGIDNVWAAICRSARKGTAAATVRELTRRLGARQMGALAMRLAAWPVGIDHLFPNARALADDLHYRAKYGRGRYKGGEVFYVERHKYRVRFVHKIASRQFEYIDKMIEVPKDTAQGTLAALLRQARVLQPGERIREMRREPSKIVVFPSRRSIWHAMVLEEMQELEMEGLLLRLPVANRSAIREALDGLDGEVVRPDVVEKLFPERYGHRYFPAGSYQPLTAVLGRLGAELVGSVTDA